MNFAPRALSGLAVVALLLTACGTTPPVSSPTPAPTGSSTSPEPSSPAASSSAPATTVSTSSSTSTSPSPAADAIVLQGKGVSKGAFGTPEDDIEGLLTAKAGKPDDSYSGPVCELDSATPYGRQLLYGSVAFLFQSKAKGKKTSPRTFTSWVMTLNQPPTNGIKLADGYPVETTFAKLKTQFPGGKTQKIALGDSVIYVYTTPSGIWYRGDDAKTPSTVGAGPMGTCE